MPNIINYRYTTTDVNAPTGGATNASTLMWNTDPNTTGYYVYNNLSAQGDWVIGNNPTIEKKEPEIKRKLFLQPRPEILIAKTPELNLFMPGELISDTPVDFQESKVDYDVLKPVGKHKDQHVYEVYEVPERPWEADQTYWDEGIEAKGLRKTPMGFYIMDDSVKYGFRRRKILELRQPPAFISSRNRLTDKKVSPQEVIARELLLRYVGLKEYKRYLRFGYIMMSAHGYDWKVPGERATIHRVIQYKKSQALYAYCVHFADPNIPATDACVMRMALIWAGVDVLTKNSNVTKMQWDGNPVQITSPVVKQPEKILTMMEAIKKVREDYKLVGNVL